LYVRNADATCNLFFTFHVGLYIRWKRSERFTLNADIGFGVGFGVIGGVGFGVGLGVCFGVGFGVIGGVGLSVGFGVGFGVGGGVGDTQALAHAADELN
jgi:hypothetical protein